MPSILDHIIALAAQPNEAQLGATLEAEALRNLWQTPLAGALGGAGLGTLAQAMRRRPNTKEEDQPSMLNGALAGGLLGGLAGGVAGTGRALDAPRRVWNETPRGQLEPMGPMRFWSEVLHKLNEKQSSISTNYSLVKTSAILNVCLERTKQAMDPRLQAAIDLGLIGGIGGLGIQGLRKLFQSKQDEEENGSPSLLKGLLMGGALGAAGGAGLAHFGGLHLPQGEPSRSGTGMAADAGLDNKVTADSLREMAPMSLMAAMAENKPAGGSSFDSKGRLDNAFKGHVMPSRSYGGDFRPELDYSDIQSNLTPWDTLGNSYFAH